MHLLSTQYLARVVVGQQLDVSLVTEGHQVFRRRAAHVHVDLVQRGLFLDQTFKEPLRNKAKQNFYIVVLLVENRCHRGF